MTSKWHELIQPGETLIIARDMFTRGGQVGHVVDVYPEGVALDFYGEVPSIEMWEWGELDQEYLEMVAGERIR